jgi:endopeptidase La
MSNNDFDNIMNEHLNNSNKRKRDENNNMNPLEYLQRRLTKNILNKLKSEIKQNKNLNLRLYIKNFRMLLTKEEKEINKKIELKEIVTFEDFLQKGSIQLTNQIIFKIFDDIALNKRKQQHKFNIISYLDDKLKLFDNLDKIKKSKKIKLDSDSDYNPEDDQEWEYEDIIIDSEEESEYDNTSEDQSTEDEDDDYYDEEKYTKQNGAAKGVKDILDDVQEQYEVEFYKIRTRGDSWEGQDECMSYFRNMTDQEKDNTISKMNELENYDFINKPLYFKILESGMSMVDKAFVLKKLKTLESLDPSQNDYVKLNTWISKLLTVPFGNYTNKTVNRRDGPNKVKKYLTHIKTTMDKAIWGHDIAKNQIMQMMAQEVNNPNSKGNVLAIYGPPGNGKTTLIKEGIAQAMGRPFAFISLGGATDSSFLEGHSYTYEGSICGKIVDVLIRCKSMDPIIYFDELDKVSGTQKGEEIINILTHLTDPSQNEHFTDKYFNEISFNLSRATIIFSYNDPSKINPILKDRITNIETSYLKLNEKIHIAKNYLLPKIFLDVGMRNKSVRFNNEVLKFIVDSFTWEGGVRKLKECLYEIIRIINLRDLSNKKINGKRLKFPIKLTIDMLKNDILEHKMAIRHMDIFQESRIGLVNGLYASCSGVGGITKIESFLMPSNSIMDLKLTGLQGDVMKESMHVAKTVAWHLIPNSTKKSLRQKWNKEGMSGIHIHCPEGATPKDGPSAGGAITTALISMLTGIPVKNTIAMTGEIDLNGYIHEIGGLEEKLEGAKRAGVQIALYPLENQPDMDKIKKDNPNLVSGNFKTVAVNNIKQILDIALERKINRLDETILHFK